MTLSLFLTPSKSRQRIPPLRRLSQERRESKSCQIRRTKRKRQLLLHNSQHRGRLQLKDQQQNSQDQLPKVQQLRCHRRNRERILRGRLQKLWLVKGTRKKCLLTLLLRAPQIFRHLHLLHPLCQTSRVKARERENLLNFKVILIYAY